MERRKQQNRPELQQDKQSIQLDVIIQNRRRSVRRLVRLFSRQTRHQQYNLLHQKEIHLFKLQTPKKRHPVVCVQLSGRPHVPHQTSASNISTLSRLHLRQL